MKNPEDNVPEKIQRATPSGGSFGKSSSGPGSRSDALTGMEKEKAVEVTEQGLEQNVEKAEGSAAKAAEDLKEEGEKSQKAISAQSAHQDMKKRLPKKDLEQADPPVKK